jgi:hypothetical protein
MEVQQLAQRALMMRSFVLRATLATSSLKQGAASHVCALMEFPLTRAQLAQLLHRVPPVTLGISSLKQGAAKLTAPTPGHRGCKTAQTLTAKMLITPQIPANPILCRINVQALGGRMSNIASRAVTMLGWGTRSVSAKYQVLAVCCHNGLFTMPSKEIGKFT